MPFAQLSMLCNRQDLLLKGIITWEADVWDKNSRKPKLLLCCSVLQRTCCMVLLTIESKATTKPKILLVAPKSVMVLQEISAIHIQQVSADLCLRSCECNSKWLHKIKSHLQDFYWCNYSNEAPANSARKEAKAYCAKRNGEHPHAVLDSPNQHRKMGDSQLGLHNWDTEKNETDR